MPYRYYLLALFLLKKAQNPCPSYIPGFFSQP
jgi:hypothetical protein